MSGFLTDTQRGTGWFYFNPTLAGYPAGDRGFILAGNGQWATAGYAHATGIRRVYPHTPGASRNVIITHGKRLSADTAHTPGFPPSTGFRPVLPLAPPAYAAGKNAA